jgi:hypothetical protein
VCRVEGVPLEAVGTQLKEAQEAKARLQETVMDLQQVSQLHFRVEHQVFVWDSDCRTLQTCLESRFELWDGCDLLSGQGGPRGSPQGVGADRRRRGRGNAYSTPLHSCSALKAALQLEDFES